ncbi:MAG: diaminopimelate epimerase [Clostridia bacterium]|nr:diaminopimelate epimerase [Clostridia bacterium]
MHFTKMQGLGNDYLYIYEEVPANVKELAIALSERHFGAGSDGLIYISPSNVADFKMRIFNADGSEAKMCGNGIRCVGKYVYDKGYTEKTVLEVETLSGIKTLHLHVQDGKVKTVEVQMGQTKAEEDLSLVVDGQAIVCTPVSVGNPHAVIFVEDMDAVSVDSIGPKIEKHEAFPGGVNVEFIQVLSSTKLRMRVWERGSGITLACGTGACASVTAAIKKGYCPVNTPITVELDGGPLEITSTENSEITMNGPAEIVYEGEVSR